MDSKKNEIVNLEFIKMIDEMRIEYQDTNFVGILLHHLANIKKYISFKEKGASVFPDRKAYASFTISCVFYSNLKSYKEDGLFKKKDETFHQSFCKDFSIPKMEYFHYTDDEKKMNKSRIFKSLKEGDILHLRIVDEEGGQFVMQILNKYEDENRLIDYSLFAVLIKDNPLVKKSSPPLQVTDFVRAVVLGKTKQEEGVFKKLLMTINPVRITDQELRHLKLGRIFKKDISYYPKDISSFQSFGAFLEANNTFESPRKMFPPISAPQCDPVQTSASSSTQDGVKKAEEILNLGDLTNALLEIEKVLNDYPEADKALTTRGKIYLAMAGGKPSSNTKKAMVDFEAALKINSLNKEATAFRDSVIMASIRSFSEKNMLDQVNELQACLKTPDHTIVSAEAFLENVKRKNKELQSADAPPVVKQEPMDI